MKLIGFGLVNLDCVAVAPGWQRDRKSEAQRYFEQVGGPVPVALACAARLGNVEATHFGVVGSDGAGAFLTGRLQAMGVTPRLQSAPGIATSRSLVFLDPTDGTRTLANYAEPLPPLAFYETVEETLRRADILHLDGRDLPGCLRAAALTRAGGGKVSYDLGTMRPGREALIGSSDIVLASKGGGAGAFPEAADDPFEQVRRFLALGPSVAGVTLAADGLVIGERGRPPVHLPAFPAPVVLDSCGAGDAFHGAFVWAWGKGASVIEAARLAQAAATLRLSQYGNDDGLPTLPAVERWIRENQ